MTMIMTAATAEHNGQGSPLTATGPVNVTFSGTVGTGNRTPVLTVYSRSESAAFVVIEQRSKFGRFRLNLSPNDQYYFVVAGVKSNDSIDLSVVAA